MRVGVFSGRNDRAPGLAESGRDGKRGQDIDAPFLIVPILPIEQRRDRARTRRLLRLPRAASVTSRPRWWGG